MRKSQWAYLTTAQHCCLTARAEKKAERQEKPLAGLRPKGRRGQAARRQRAHPLGSAHASKGADDGAKALLSLSSALTLARVIRD